MSRTDLEAVRGLFETQRSGVLCTAHAATDDWPYGSVVPYAMLANGDACVFLSDIAEHTRNLLRTPRATLLVLDPAAAGEPQAGSRHAMMVRAHCPEGDAREAVEKLYFERFPGAERMREAHGFRVWVLACERVRWIAGYGSMGWFDRASWTGERDPLTDEAVGIVEHLNADHADALRELAVAAGCVETGDVRAVACDCGGLDLEVRQDGADAGRPVPLRLTFSPRAERSDDVRQAVIEMLRRVRAK
ncbi:MAG: HugZ family protein [Planctomycetota bacterium]